MSEYEYRVHWATESNASFHGETDWFPCGDAESAEDAENGLYDGSGALSTILQDALDASGFECWVDVREASR